MKKIKNTILIGLGSVGALYDRIDNRLTTTHLKSLNILKQYNLNYKIDLDKNKKKIIKNFKNINFTSNLNVIKKEINKDTLVVLSSPTKTHLKIFLKLIKFGIKNIFFEKPIGKNINENIKILKLCNKNKISIYTNYFRRYLTAFNKIKSKIKSNSIGHVIGGTFIYDKYLLNNGCHAIDLLNFFLNEKKKFKIEGILKKKKDKKGLIIDFIINKDNSRFLFKCNENLKKRDLDIKMYGTKGMIHFSQTKKSLLKIIKYNKKKIYFKNYDYEFNNRQLIVFKKLYRYMKKQYITDVNFSKLIYPQLVMNKLGN